MSENDDLGVLSQIEILLEQVRGDRHNSKAESGELKQEIASKDEDIQRLTTELDSKNEQYDALQVRLEEEKKTSQDYESQLGKADRLRQEDQSLYQLAQDKVSLLRRENVDLKLDIEGRHLSGDEDMVNLEAKLEEKDAEICRMQRDLGKKKFLLRLTAHALKVNGELTEKCNGLEQDYSELSRENDSLGVDYDKLKKEHDELKRECDALQSSYRKSEHTFNDVKRFVNGVTDDDPIVMFFALQETYSDKSVGELIDIYHGIQTTSALKAEHVIVLECKGPPLNAVGSSFYTLSSKVFNKNNAVILGVSMVIAAAAFATFLYATGEYTKLLETATDYINNF